MGIEPKQIRLQRITLPLCYQSKMVEHPGFEPGSPVPKTEMIGLDYTNALLNDGPDPLKDQLSRDYNRINEVLKRLIVL